MTAVPSPKNRSVGPPVSPRAAHAILILTVIIWASSFAAIRFVLRQTDSMTMTTIRLGTAALVMLVIAGLLKVPIPDRGDWTRLGAAGFLGFSVYHYLLNLGSETVAAGQASFIVATAPIWTAMLAWRFLGERLSFKNWAGLVVGLVGVAVMSLDPGALSIGLGSLLILVSAACAGANIVLSKDLLRRYRAIDLTAYSAIIGALPFLIHLPWSLQASADLDLWGWVVLIYLGVVPIGLGYWLNSIALAALSASRVAQMLLLIPPLAAIIAWVAIGETPSAMLFVGGPLILVGVWLGRKSPQ